LKKLFSQFVCCRGSGNDGDVPRECSTMWEELKRTIHLCIDRSLHRPSAVARLFSATYTEETGPTGTSDNTHEVEFEGNQLSHEDSDGLLSGGFDMDVEEEEFDAGMFLVNSDEVEMAVEVYPEPAQTERPEDFDFDIDMFLANPDT
jgi:hypothetical protein